MIAAQAEQAVTALLLLFIIIYGLMIGGGFWLAVTGVERRQAVRVLVGVLLFVWGIVSLMGPNP